MLVRDEGSGLKERRQVQEVNGSALGFSMLFLAGAMNGSFALPMKFTRKWAWENTWAIWTLFALFLFPFLLAYVTVPQLNSAYSQAGAWVVFLVAVCGAGWGIAQVLFGLAVEAIGIALTFSVVLGLSAALGSLIPLFRLHPNEVVSPAGLAAISGVALVLVGVGICAVAGRKREAALGATKARTSVTRGLVFCALSGVLASLMNFGLAFGGPILEAAQKNGAPKLWSPNAVFFPLMLAGGVPNLAYCVYLMRKNNTANRFREVGSASHWFLAGFMAVAWFGSTILYGASTTTLGQLGTVLAWPLFMSLIVITASICGAATGEWKSAGPQPFRVMAAGVGVLILAIFVLALSSRMRG
jgi:L-rhamnose-H+ transport protein